MDKKICITELKGFINQIQSLLDLFGQQNRLFGDKKDQAQEMLKSFKKNLEVAFRTRDTVKGEKNMTEIEKRYFFPAIHEAFANLTITTNSIPNEKWKFELIDTQNTIEYYLHQLEQED